MQLQALLKSFSCNARGTLCHSNSTKPQPHERITVIEEQGVCKESHDICATVGGARQQQLQIREVFQDQV
jgi:hypothetical protein